jgi:hypothetical protein
MTLFDEFKKKAGNAVSDAAEILRATDYHNESKHLRWGHACDNSADAVRRAEYVAQAERLVIRECKEEILKLAARLAIESIGI